MDGHFLNKMFFTDEAHVTLRGYVNKENCRIWGSENPQVIEERPLYPEERHCSVLSLVRRRDWL